jgi:hypothetical protein
MKIAFQFNIATYFFLSTFKKKVKIFFAIIFQSSVNTNNCLDSQGIAKDNSLQGY